MNEVEGSVALGPIILISLFVILCKVPYELLPLPPWCVLCPTYLVGFATISMAFLEDSCGPLCFQYSRMHLSAYCTAVRLASNSIQAGKRLSVSLRC